MDRDKIEMINLQIEERTKYIMKKLFQAQMSLMMYDYFEKIEF